MTNLRNFLFRMLFTMNYFCLMSDSFHHSPNFKRRIYWMKNRRLSELSHHGWITWLDFCLFIKSNCFSWTITNMTNNRNFFFQIGSLKNASFLTLNSLLLSHYYTSNIKDYTNNHCDEHNFNTLIRFPIAIKIWDSTYFFLMLVSFNGLYLFITHFTCYSMI